MYGGEGRRGGGEKGFATVVIQLNPAYGSLSSFARVPRITSWGFMVSGLNVYSILVFKPL